MSELVKRLRTMIEYQASDAGLWFVAQTAPEGYLQAALRQAHEGLEKAADALERREEDADEMRVTLSCGCKSRYHGFPSRWPSQDRVGDDCITYGVLCERHFYEYEAEPAQYVDDSARTAK